jgi:hypothetical protein
LTATTPKTFNVSAITNGDATNNRFAQLMFRRLDVNGMATWHCDKASQPF